MAQSRNEIERAEAAYERARALHLAGEAAGAHGAYLRALAAHPRPAAVYHDLGVLLRATSRPQAAVACYRRALRLEPNDPDTWSNLGRALREISDHPGALAAFEAALALGPKTPLAHKNIGWAQHACRQFAKAAEAFAAALELDPDDAEARLHLGLSLLHQGAYSAGFCAFEARIESTFEAADAVAPLWDGAPLGGRHLLVQSEQGLGDILQFSRFLRPLAEAAGGPVSCEVPAPLLQLFQANFPDICVFERGTPAPPHDLWVPMGSLPHRLGITEATLVPKCPYLAPSGHRPHLPSTGRLKVGLTWSGNRAKLDRSCPFGDFIALLGVGGVDFYSFQRGEPARDIGAHAAGGLVTDLGSQLSDFAEDATHLAQLDLVISVDTAFCHLAGAMGVPCWVLLAPHADWRYPGEGATTPWYPSFELIRTGAGAGADGGWPNLISRTRARLQNWVDRRSGLQIK